MALQEIDFDFEEAYDIIQTDDSVIDEKPWLIHSFWALGLADPFPDESTLFDTKNKFCVDLVPFTV